MYIDDLRNEAIRTAPQRMPLRVSEALRLFLDTQLEVLPVMQGDYLKGLYFRDAIPLILCCSNNSACADSVPSAILREMPYMDIASDEEKQVESMKLAIEGETSAALIAGTVYLGMVPLKKIVAFVHEHRLKEAITINPLTGLPGNLSIKKEFARRAACGEPFYVCYLDMNDFKAYNDKYGVAKGDEAIRFAGFVLADNCGGGFVGHVGGDDFIFFLPVDDARGILDNIAADFDRGIMDFYSETHRRQGCIISVDRDGKTRSFPIMSVAIVAAEADENSSFDSVNDSLASLKADVKRQCKDSGGSRYAFDKRRAHVTV